MSDVNLVWATPDADLVMGKIARVSNPANQDNPNVTKLLRYCAKNGHWSVFEHSHACLSIVTSRDIGRQIIRHKSFAYSEFSQRYANVTLLGDDFISRECRTQDHKNRQNSIVSFDESLNDEWSTVQREVWDFCISRYREALDSGVAKEQARALLPEGLTKSRIMMTGSIRSWIHYIQVRSHESTQAEHRVIANQALDVLRGVAPITMGAIFDEQEMV